MSHGVAESVEVSHAITSVPRDPANAATLLVWHRGHWGIEHRLHWVRDETMGEEANGTRCGSIIMVASIASHMAIRSQRSSAYCGTKGAVRAMVAPIAAELNKYGIRVNSISPGYVRTEMTAPFPHLLDSWKDEIMNGRVAEPDNLKGACVFLASDASR